MFNISHTYIQNNFIFSSENIIPQNKKNFFVIKKSESWRYSIDIIFDQNADLNFKNLCIIILSLINIDQIPAYDLATTSIDIEYRHSIQIMSITKIIWLKTLNRVEFIEWLQYRILKDGKYIEDKSLYCIRITYEKFFIEKINKEKSIDCMTMLKPLYPWNDLVNDFWEKNFDKSLLVNEIEKLKKELDFYKKHTPL